jgi:GxxExxY protein
MTLTHESTDNLSRILIGLAIEVHRHLGPGVLESHYEECLSFELDEAGIPYRRQVALPIVYRGRSLSACYRPDLVVRNEIILEIKAVEKLASVHKAQLMTYLKHTGIKTGLLLNFNTAVLIDGLVRISL